MKKLLLLLLSTSFFVNASQAQTNTITKCYTGPTQSYGNTFGSQVGSINIISGVDLPPGQKIIDITVEVVWSKTDDGSCGAASGIASNLSHIGFRLRGPSGGSRDLALSAATGPFATPPTTASFIGTFPPNSAGVINDITVFKDGYPSLLPAHLPIYPARDTVAPISSLSFYRNTDPYGTWSFEAIDDAPLAGPKLCIHSFCFTIRTCTFNTTPPVPTLASLPDINATCLITALTPPTANDECDYTVSHNLTLPYSTPGTTVITWTYTDVWGNTTTQAQNLNILAIPNQTVTASPSSICSGSSSTVTVGSTNSGVNYFLRDNSNNAIIAGPTAGTGAAINFNTGALTTSKTYNVYATKSGLTPINALRFTGNAGLKKVSLGTSIWTDNFVGTNKLTVEAWVNRSSTGSLHSIIGNYEGSYPFLFRIDGDKATLFVNSSTSAVGATSIPVGTWTHLAATYDGTTIKIYVNGVLDGSVAYSGNFISTTNEVKIGGGLSDNTEYFPGDIADVRLWNVARTQAQIAASKDLVLYCNEAGLIANYQFNEGSGTTTVNTVNESAYTGTLVNAPAWVTGPTLTGSICNLEMSTVVSVNVNTVSTAPSIAPVLGADCPNTSIILTASGGVAGTSSLINWYTGPAGTGMWLGTGSSITVSPSSTATYYARREGLCNNTTDATVTVNVTPNNTVSAASSSPTLCSNTALTNITHTTTGATGVGTATGLPAGVSVAWASNTITISGSPTASGVFNYSIPLTGGCGTFDATGTITVNESPVANTIIDNNVSCYGLADGSATADVAGGTGAYTYAWSNGQNTAIAGNLLAGVYTYTVTDANSCTTSASATITEPAAIDATTSLNAETITATQTSATYQWVDCDNANTPITNETNQSFIATAYGNYAVIVTVGACNEMSACVNIASVGLRDITSINYTVKPNPSTGLFTITANTSESMTVKVYDMIGKLIVSQSTANNSLIIDLSNCENGIYSLTIETASKKSTSRIVLTK